MGTQHDYMSKDIHLYIDGNYNFVCIALDHDEDLDHIEEDRLLSEYWLKKYKTTPSNTVEVSSPCGTIAWAIHKDNDLLSKQEWEWCYKMHESGSGSITVSELWDMVYELNWRPGQPVSEDDPGWDWLAKRYENDDWDGTRTLFRRALNMEPIPQRQEGL